MHYLLWMLLLLFLLVELLLVVQELVVIHQDTLKALLKVFFLAFEFQHMFFFLESSILMYVEPQNLLEFHLDVVLLVEVVEVVIMTLLPLPMLVVVPSSLLLAFLHSLVSDVVVT